MYQKKSMENFIFAKQKSDKLVHLISILDETKPIIPIRFVLFGFICQFN